MLLSSNHHEQIRFHILEQPGLPLIMGFPWLRWHNPNIDWEIGIICEWGPVPSELPKASRLSADVDS